MSSTVAPSPAISRTCSSPRARWRPSLSDRKPASYIRLVEFVAPSFDDDRAAIHHGDAVRQIAREVEILLDQQNGQPAALAQQANDPRDFLDDARLDALGRLVEHEQTRPHYQRACDRQLLLLSSRQIAAAP